MMIGPYRVKKTIGNGSFGKVKLAEHSETGESVAIKIVRKSIVDAKSIRREIAVQKLIDFPYILKILDLFETEEYLYIILEYASNGELFNHIVMNGRLTESESLMFFQQIVFGLEYCHGLSIAHRDIKPENILLDSAFNIKVADFGLASLCATLDQNEQYSLKTQCGSPYYTAPEVFTGAKYDGMLSDVWSTGVLLYVMINGVLPFEDKHLGGLLRKISAGKYRETSHMGKDLRDLISKMLTVDPAKRITIQEIKDHPWFTQNLPQFFILPNPAKLYNLPKRITRPRKRIVNHLVSLGWGKRKHVLDLLSAPGTNLAKAFYILYQESEKSEKLRCVVPFRSSQESEIEALLFKEDGGTGNGGSSVPLLRNTRYRMSDLEKLRGEVVLTSGIVNDETHLSDFSVSVISTESSDEAESGQEQTQKPKKLSIKLVRENAVPTYLSTRLILGSPRYGVGKKRVGGSMGSLTPRPSNTKKRHFGWNFLSKTRGAREKKNRGLAKDIDRLCNLISNEPVPRRLVRIEKTSIQVLFRKSLLRTLESIQMALDLLGFHWNFPNLRKFEVKKNGTELLISIHPVEDFVNRNNFVACFSGKGKILPFGNIGAASLSGSGEQKETSKSKGGKTVLKIPESSFYDFPVNWVVLRFRGPPNPDIFYKLSLLIKLILIEEVEV